MPFDKGHIIDVRFLSPGGLGDIQIIIDGLVDIYKGDRIETESGTMFHVEKYEYVEDLFEDFTIAWLTVTLGNTPLPVKIDKELSGNIKIYPSIERAAERALWFGETNVNGNGLFTNINK